MTIDTKTPAAYELAEALGDFLEAQGFPGIKSIVDHLQVLYYMESIEPEAYWLGSSPEEKASNHRFEINQLRSILTLELSAIGSDMVTTQEAPAVWN